MHLILFILIIFIAEGPQSCLQAATPQKIRTLYSSLDPSSVSQHLAFYHLFPETAEGKASLRDAWNLLSGGVLNNQNISSIPPSVQPFITTLVSLVNKQPGVILPDLGEEELDFIEKLGSRLRNRTLKGRNVFTEQEVINLPSDEIDLARGLLLSEMGEENLAKIRSYEAVLDIMALQILTKVGLDADPKKKVSAINSFIFSEMGYRFPPHSVYAKNIDVYTFLPSVMDSRKGVCLGVSILYICLAQRLGLQMEMITPPGHIYVRFNDGREIINIETTARGIHLDSEEYLTPNTRSLQTRNVKDVIGLAHFNQAAVWWQADDHKKALESYKKAEKYLPHDMLLKELMAYNYLLDGQLAEGTRLLKEVIGHLPDHAVVKDSIAEDFLKGSINEEGIDIVFQKIDEKRESILKKKERIEQILEKYPRFRAGIFALAVAWFQLHRQREALETLERYYELEKNDPTAEYYLAALYAERMNYPEAWKHLKQAEQIVQSRNHYPKSLKDFKRELSKIYPD